jgi:hypothetical protein
MSDDDSPLRSLFSTQQALISNGQRFLEQTMRVPLELDETLRQSLERQRTLQQETLGITREAVDGVLDTAARADPGSGVGEVRQAVDEGFETLQEGHDETFDRVEEGYEEALEGLGEALEELTAQSERLVELNRQLEASTLEAVDGMDGSLGEVVEQQLGDLDEELDSPAEAEGTERIERQREGIETVRDRIEELQADLEETVEAAREARENGESTGEDSGS